MEVEVPAAEAGVKVEVEVLLKSHSARNTLICRQGSGTGALCTENGGGGLIFVQSPPHAPGRTSLPPNPRIETGTSPEHQ